MIKYLNSKVVVDKDILGWLTENKNRLKDLYEDIIPVGKLNSPIDLQDEKMTDGEIAEYCIKNKCDLFTADKTSYLTWFNQTTEINRITITKFDYWKTGNRPILLIEIINNNIESSNTITHEKNELEEKIKSLNFSLSNRIKIGKSLERAPYRTQYKIVSMVNQAINEFPELGNDVITVGITYAHDGNAQFETDKSYLIRLNPRRITFFTIGHELTHLIQWKKLVPEGETQSDIFTIARSDLFLDEPPSYLKIPKKLNDYWEENSYAVHKLCKEAIEYRKTHKQYIVWLEKKLKNMKILKHT